MRFSLKLRGMSAVLVLGLVLGWATDSDGKNRKKRGDSGASSASADAGEGSGGDFVTEKRSDGTTVKYKKKTSYDFEGLGVEAMADKPTGAYISNIKDVKARSMIQIRKDFDAEVFESARQMP